MAVFIELTTDPFESNYNRLKSKNDASVSRAGRAGLSNVRRPLRGMEIKEDTYASLKVLQADGTEVPFLDSSSATGQSTSYSNFILQSVQEARMEKHQIVETFGDYYVYMFGESPRFLDVQAILINSQDFNWEAEWWANWNSVLRGSKSVENGARTYLFYDDNVVEGYMLMSNATKVSGETFMVTMSFRMLVSNYRNVSFIGDPNFPVSEAVALPPDVTLTSADAFSQLVSLYTNSTDTSGQLSDWNNQVNQNANGTFGSVGNLVDTLNVGTRSVAFPASVQAYVNSLQASGAMPGDPSMAVMNQLTSKPLRGLIADNTDEYTGSGGTSVDYTSGQLPEVFDPRVRDQLEVDDLFYSAISWMACFGANVNSYGSVAGLGLGVSFGAGPGVGIGLGVGIGAGIGGGATFSPTARAGVGYGGSAGQGMGFGASAGIGFSSGSFAGPGTFGSAASVSALNAQQFGSASSASPQGQVGAPDVLFGSGGGNAVSPDPTSLITGFGDPTYGYPSPYGGPGYGVAGYGDYGGLGFGSSLGATGDPGFLSPDQFTLADVADPQSALDRLTTPSPGFGSGFGGVGVGDSYAGSGAGASVSVGGAVSAFSLDAYDGTLDPTGQSLGGPSSCTNTLGGVQPNPLTLL